MLVISVWRTNFVCSKRSYFIAIALILASPTADVALAQQQTRESPANPSAADVQPAPTPAESQPVEKPRAPAEAKEIPATIIEGTAAVALIGRPVQSAKNEDLGRIVDVITDREGRLRAAVIDFGGFLGVGTRKIAVDWRALHFSDNGGMDKLIAELPRDQLRSAPVYKEGEPIVVIGAPVPAPHVGPAAQKP